ncbi:guanosine-diphosphatase-like protein [Xylogone sp. PMI_703]|nr:guanosine-diphosphatase-like protein [Xylogone sp. PMI_703]
MRRTSVSLPTKHTVAHDPYEKLARYESKGANVRELGLSGNSKTAWMTQSQRSRYVKTGGILLFIVFLFYYFSPSGIDVQGRGSDPIDPAAGTTRCSKPHDSSKPLVQYALMIDAGSTGSRIHVYKFNNCGPTPELENEEFKMTEKKPEGSGLSSYKSDAEGAAKSLDVLMDVAMNTVPDKFKACTPVAVKATAGLRLLGPEMSDKILEAVRHRLETVYPFPVVSRENKGVAIMDGSDEGVYAWITTNYLLGKIGTPDDSPTAAVFDLGGGSTQIVFEPTFKGASHGGMPEKLAEGDHRYELNFGGRKFELYQHSHLGYGLMSAREAIHRQFFQDIESMHEDDYSWTKSAVVNPCIAPGMTRAVNVTLPKDHPYGKVALLNMTGPSSPSPAQCRKLAEKILYKDAECKLAPCSFNGIHQPSIERTFATEDIYIFSYFYDRTDPLGMPESFTLKELHDLTDQVCGGPSRWDAFENVPDAIKELEDRPEWCLDLNFMMALLHTGYEIPIEREVKIAKKIKGNELGWCLGASLPLLSQESGWTCRIKEIS